MLRQARLEEAIKLYRAAHEEASDWAARKLAARNVAVACSKLAALFLDERRALFSGWLKQGFEVCELAGTESNHRQGRVGAVRGGAGGLCRKAGAHPDLAD